MVDNLPDDEYDDIMEDALGVRATAMKGMDITGCFEDAKFTIELYCGITDGDVVVVQLAEERGNSKRKSSIVPLDSFTDLPPVSIIKFLAPSSWLKPELISKIIREHAR